MSEEKSIVVIRIGQRDCRFVQKGSGNTRTLVRLDDGAGETDGKPRKIIGADRNGSVKREAAGKPTNRWA